MCRSPLWGSNIQCRLLSLDRTNALRPIVKINPVFMTKAKLQLRQIHRSLAPIMVLPLILTLLTGSVYQMFDLAGRDENVRWLLALHKGHFGTLNLEIVYPFLNALGLLTMAVTGISMWLKGRRQRGNRQEV